MSSAVIRECWNRGLTAEEFIEEIQSKYMNSFESIAQELATICGVSDETIVLLYDYLAIMFNKFSVRTVAAINLSSAEQIRGCNITFSKYGEKIFNVDALNTYDSCQTALKILEIILTCQDKNLLEAALKQIPASHNLPVCIAASQVYHPVYFKKIRDMFKELNYDFKPGNTNHLEANLVSSISDDIPCFKPRLTLLDNVILDYFLFVFHKMFYRASGLTNHDEHSIQHFYIAILENFVNQPLVTEVHVLTCILVPLIYAMIHGESFTQRIAEIDFDIEKFIEVVNYLPEKCFAKISISKQNHIAEFTRPYTNNLDLDHFQVTLMYPTELANIIPHYKNLMFSDSPELIKKGCKEVSANVCDFCYLLVVTGNIESFLIPAITQLQTIADKEAFTDFIFCIISVIKEIWKTGDADGRNAIQEVVTSSSSFPNFLLSCFLQLSTVDSSAYSTLQMIYNASSHIERCCSFLHFLFYYGYTNDIKNLLVEYPYLWISVFTWGFQCNSKDCLKVFKPKFPNYDVFEDLFSQLIVRVCDDKKYRIVEHADFDVYIKYPQRLDTEIENHLNAIFSRSQDFVHYPTYIFNNFMICCRAYIYLGKLRELVILIIDLIAKVPDMFEQDDILMVTVYIIASLLSFVFNDDSQKSALVIEVLLEMIVNNEYGTREVKAAVPFCLAMVMAAKDGMDERLEMIINLCRKAINSSAKSQQISTFAYYFMKVAIYYPNVRSKIPIDMFQVFNIIGDLKASIDFFKVKALVIESQGSR